MNREDKNEIIWRLRQETGKGLMDIERGLDALIDALKRKPYAMDIAYDLKFEWKPNDMRKPTKGLRPECTSCVNNLTGLYPCAKIMNRDVQDYLDGKTNDCPEWYDEC